MPKVISGHIKIELPLFIMKSLLNVNLIKHRMVVDINIQGLSYGTNATVCTEFPMPSKFNF